MRPESYKLFAQLLEGYVDEASTSLDLITGAPGGKEVIIKLHKEMQLAHNQDYRQIDKISWSELKGAYNGAWVIIKGANGIGAIKSRGDTYEAVASSGGEPRVLSDSRGGNILDFLKGEIGKLQKFYVGKGTRAVDDKKKKRADQKKGLSQEVTVSSLTIKFKPLWIRAITSAIADVKGYIANQIKNDAFDKAEKKLNHVRKLQNAIDALEAGESDVPGSISTAINTAVVMAASYHYPEQTGSINRGYGSGSYSTQFPEGTKQLLADIAAGDQKKLGTVLGFFKRTLISG